MSAGMVVIGRNEGQRLARCLASVQALKCPAVYVDSASCDGSAALARSLGVPTVELDRARPMSAARARNEGFDALLQAFPALRFVQFLDGDCTLLPRWIEGRLLLTHMQVRLGRQEVALARMRRVVADFPDHAEAKAVLAQLERGGP